MKRRKTFRSAPFLLPFLLFLAVPSLPDERVEIHSIRYFTHPTYTRIVIDVGELREYVYNRLKSPDRIYVDIYQAKLNPILYEKKILVQADYLSQIRVAQKTSSTVRIVADMNLDISSFRVWHLPDPFRIIIDIHPSKFYRPSQPGSKKLSIIRQLGLGVQRVVIDPGHGGKDPGCVGKNGTLEKDVVLTVSRLLKTLLEKDGLEVILTRGSDIFLPVENRTVIANQKQADLFISIHANATRNRKLSGVETFYLNFSQDPSVIATAARENATSTKNISKMKDIIEKIIQNTKIPESKELAKDIQNNLVSSLSKKYSNINSLGVKGGPFWVLIGAEVPSVLVEISFLSNPTEEKRLQSTQYRQRIAQGIYEGIMAYKHSLEKGTVQ
ncbi:MAG: N-acetylmuramoyl-L-alanine amidase [Candidatus Aminicenantes bacterium]|nr:N-acetylmuramoyl-L-alanine amidase [Candidatus Aminicenantes bacterium]